MPVLIDGYNLMYAAGLISPGLGPASLARSRSALLNFVAASLPQADLADSIVVFDASQAPRGLPRTLRHRGLSVRFAAEHADADALIEELIQQSSAPKRLTVVSSDHRLQRAARRRRAKAVDSDKWFASVVEQRALLRTQPGRAPAKPRAPLAENEVAYWLREFTDALANDARSHSADEAGAAQPSPPASSKDPEDSDDPFPTGYFDDLFDDVD